MSESMELEIHRTIRHMGSIERVENHDAVGISESPSNKRPPEDVATKDANKEVRLEK